MEKKYKGASLVVIPAKAGIHPSTAPASGKWVPAFAGTTIEGLGGSSLE
jgi:hypothetical protein